MRQAGVKTDQVDVQADSINSGTLLVAVHATVQYFVQIYL